MNFLGLSSFGLTHFMIIGLFQGACLLIVVLLLLWKLMKFENRNIGMSAAMFFSPGLLFLIERGNLDIVMILLITVSFLLYRKNAYLSWSLLALSASFKFYSVPLLLLASVLQKKTRTRILLLFLSIVLTSILIVELLKFQITFPFSLFLGFGAPLIPGWINLLLDHQELVSFRISTGLGYLVSTSLVAGFGLFFRRHIQLKRNLVFDKEGYRLLTAFIFAATVYLSCYFSGFSYDIRLIYLAACLSILIAIVEMPRKFEIFILINIFSAFWIGAQFGLNFSSFQTLNVVIQAIGDLSILILTSTVFVGFLKGIKLLTDETGLLRKLSGIIGINRNSRVSR